MLGLNKGESKSFISFFVLHGVLFTVAGFLGLIPSCEEKEEVHVFELASAYSAPTILDQPKAIAPTPEAIPEVPPPPQPKPIQRAQIKPKPNPKPQIKPTPPPQPKPRPIQKPKTISFNQFKKQHNIKPAPIKQNITQKVPKVKIDPSKFSLPPIQLSGTTPNSSAVSPTVLNRYLGEVKAKLEQAWIRLQKNSNLGVGGEAFLSFKISSSGSLIYPSISKSSGNAALDQLVLQVSKSVGNLGRPPGGKLSSSLEIPFRLR